MKRVISQTDDHEEFEATFIDEDGNGFFMLKLRKGEVSGTFDLDADQLTAIQDVIKAGLTQ